MRIVTLFQQIVHWPTGQIIGCEATIRGEDEQGKQYAAGQLFHHAAVEGKVEQLDLEARSLSIRYGIPLLKGEQRLFLNIAPESIQNRASWFSTTNISLHRITLEITEHSPLTITDSILERLNRLRRKGMKLAIDDFGSGYHSLRLIDLLKPDYLKLDKMITIDSSDKTLKSMVSFCKESDISLIAEGVESNKQLERLVRLGITNFQGYLFGYPAPCDELKAIKNVM